MWVFTSQKWVKGTVTPLLLTSCLLGPQLMYCVDLASFRFPKNIHHLWPSTRIQRHVCGPWNTVENGAHRCRSTSIHQHRLTNRYCRICVYKTMIMPLSKLRIRIQHAEEWYVFRNYDHAGQTSWEMDCKRKGEWLRVSHIKDTFFTELIFTENISWFYVSISLIRFGTKFKRRKTIPNSFPHANWVFYRNFRTKRVIPKRGHSIRPFREPIHHNDYSALFSAHASFVEGRTLCSCVSPVL